MSSALLRRQFLAYAPRASVASRSFGVSATHFSSSKKEALMDKDAINTGSTEHSKSGGDDAAARATEDTAFSGDKTRPEEQHASAANEAGGKSDNPLEVSAANPHVSRPKDQTQQEGAEGSPGETGNGSGRARTSGGS